LRDIGIGWNAMKKAYQGWWRKGPNVPRARRKRRRMPYGVHKPSKGFAKRHSLAAMCTTAEMQPGSGIIIGRLPQGEGEVTMVHLPGDLINTVFAVGRRARLSRGIGNAPIGVSKGTANYWR
jgi:hypothetical protein